MINKKITDIILDNKGMVIQKIALTDEPEGGQKHGIKCFYLAIVI